MNLFHSRAATRRSLVTLATAAVAAASLAACGGGSGGSSSTAKSGGSGNSGGSATSGTVNWWGWTPTDTATAKSYVAEFNKKYPDIKVNYKLVSISDWQAALRPALASNSGPDVFDIQPGTYVTKFGSFAEDLTPVIQKALGSDWKSKIAPIGISGLTDKQGRLTAISVGSTYAGSLWINQQIFDKYGLKAPKTLDEWDKVCQALKSHKQGCFVQGASGEGFDQDTLQAISNSVEPGFWTKIYQGKAKWDSPQIVKTLSIWKELFTRGIMQEGAIGYQQYPDANNDFLTGKYGMVMMGTWYTQYATQKAMTAALSSAGVSGAKPFPIVPIQFPDVAGSGNTSEMFGDSDYGLAVAKKSKNKAAAETFVSWLATTKEGQQVVADQLNDLPSLKTVQPDFTKIKLVDPSVQTKPVQDLVKKVASVTEPRFALSNADIENAILEAATSVASGKSTPEAAAKSLQSVADSAK
jgi:raffinose/stachyose/melibiose transport system substrate-binding protein